MSQWHNLVLCYLSSSRIKRRNTLFSNSLNGLKRNMKCIYYHVQFLFSFRFISAPHKSVFLVTYLSGNIMIIILPKVFLCRQYLHISLFISLFTSLCNAPINVNPVGGGGGGVRARGGDLMPGAIPAVGLFDRVKRPRGRDI